jgi:phosphatidylserine decarboxylase
MLTYRYPLIAQEGWWLIAITAIVAGGMHLLAGWFSLPLWLLVLVLLFLFRDPRRKVPASPLGIVSPVDGRVIAVERVHNAYLERSAICISIRMSLISVWSVHSPMEGKVMEQWLAEPRRIEPMVLERDAGVATFNQAKMTKAYAQWIQSDEDDDVVLAIAVGSRWRQPQCYARSGERIGQGQRCGLVRFGSQVDVLVPESSRIEVRAGDRVQGASSIIATLVHPSVKPPKPMPVDSEQSGCNEQQ